MKIISHRGYWKRLSEKNTLKAFERSFAHGFGTETDLRDLAGELVISHDPAEIGAIPASKFFALAASCSPCVPLALNIKSDGLQGIVKQALVKAGITDYFLFDMSVPDALKSSQADLRIYTRHSECESHPVLYAESVGVWMDAMFDHSWINPDAIRQHLRAGKKVCVVSPELHQRIHLEFWTLLRSSRLHVEPHLTICTDFPKDAECFFYE